MASSASRQQFLQLLIFLWAIFWTTCSPVSAVRNTGTIVNVTITNDSGDSGSLDNISVSQYLTDQGLIDPLYEFGWANRKENPGEYTLSVVWTHYGIPTYRRIIWTMNRNRPVKPGAQFTFVPNGSLILYDSDGSGVWSTHTDGMGAQGLELNSTHGEFRLYGDQNQTIWSSFQHPTDTMVAGQELVWGMQLVSGTSSTDNSEGAYSLVMEPAGMVLYASLPDPHPYYVWNYFAESADHMPVSSLFQVCDKPVFLRLYEFGQVALTLDADRQHPIPLPVNKDNYSTSPALCNFTGYPPYSFMETSSYPITANTTFMVLESDGSLRVYAFNPGTTLTEDFNFFAETQCDLPATCGGYGVCKANGQCGCPIFSVSDPHSFLLTNSSEPSEGCSYSGGPLALGTECTADASKHQHMGQVTAVDYFSNKFTAARMNTSSMDECESLCMNNCSCTASFYHSDSMACYAVSEPLLSLESTGNSNQTAFVKISGVSLKKKSSSNVAVGVGIGVSCFAAISLLVLGSVVYRSRRKARLARKSKEDEFLETLPGLPPRYSKKELDAATLGFTKTLGSGGFGTVYEGSLMDGSKIAVKKLESSKGTKDFRAEMATLGSIHHVNLVRLKGFCAEGVDNMLVYEYMPNGSLDRWLFRSDPASESTGLLSDSLDWDTRFKIALGTARGLAYLHEGCAERIIHLDIKPQNILLDEDFNPKVADFGLSKLVDRGMSMVVTTMRGTPGYLAPEWLLQAAVTERTDVYSYGIVLLELVAGRKCLDFSKQDPKQRYVPAWLLHCIITNRDILDIVDPRLDMRTKEDEPQITTVIYIALQCIQEDMMHRPSMGVVVQMLEGLVRVPDFQRDSISTMYRFATSMESQISPRNPFRGFTTSFSRTLSSGVSAKQPFSGFSASGSSRLLSSSSSMRSEQM